MSRIISPMSPAADASRLPTRFVVQQRPLSLRGAWHRLSLLGALAILLAFPWVTSTGCDGKAAPTTYSGYELLHDGIHHDWWLGVGPLALLASAALVFAVARATHVLAPRPRFFVHVGAFVLALAGVALTAMALAIPTAADVVTEHAAWALGTAALLALFADAAVRVFLGAREWRRDVLARRATGGITAPAAPPWARVSTPL